MTNDTVDEVLSLDISGDYGHFRKNYTTSSPLTHCIPPRTALTGLLGAIMGYPPSGEENYHRVFTPTQTKIAVVPRAPIRKQRINKNMLKIKGDTGNLASLNDPPSEITRNQVPFEVLRQPHYTLYIWHSDSERLAAFEDQFATHKSVYTPYLGISEFLAEFDFRGRYSVTSGEGEATIASVVNTGHHDIAFEQGKRYQRENISLVMDEQRVVQSFADVMYAQYRREGEARDDQHRQGEPTPLQVQNGRHFTVEGTGERIAFLTG